MSDELIDEYERALEGRGVEVLGRAEAWAGPEFGELIILIRKGAQYALDRTCLSNESAGELEQFGVEDTAREALSDAEWLDKPGVIQAIRYRLASWTGGMSPVADEAASKGVADMLEALGA